MEYLFLRRKETTATSPRQRELLFKTAEKQWEKEFTLKRKDGKLSRHSEKNMGQRHKYIVKS